MNARHPLSILAIVEDTVDTPGSARARYHTPQNWTCSRPKVPLRQFLEERDRAFDPDCPTGLIPLDLSATLGVDTPATTPALLVRYMRLREGEGVNTVLQASGEIYYVLRGTGASRSGGDRIAWGPGDVFCFPGGQTTSHACESDDALLVLCTNEPLLALEGLRAAAPGQARFHATHWPADEIERELSGIWRRPMLESPHGHFVQLSADAEWAGRSVLPTVSVIVNTLPQGWDQPQHRLGGTTITLALQGERVHSMVDGQRVNWSTGAMQITPPMALQSHHNHGRQRMRALVFHDEMLNFYARTAAFRPL